MFVSFWTVLILLPSLSYPHPSKRQINNHSTDENFVFTKAEIVTTVKLSDSTEVYVEAFKNKDNDNVIKQIESNPLKSGIGSLRFISLGYPQLLQSGAKRSTIPYFFLTASGFTIGIRTLTDEIRKALASAASTQYQFKIGSDQILLLVPTSWTCDLTITTENISYSIRGKSTTFNTNPIKVDFKVPLKSVEKSLLESPTLTLEMLSITCEVIKRAQTAPTDTLIVSLQQLDSLKLKDKLIGSGDKAFVTRNQMIKLSTEIQQTLNIQDLYETSGSFDDNFFRDILDNFDGQEAFKPLPIQEVLKNLSPYKLDSDLRPDKIYKELSSQLKIEGSGSKQHIVAARNPTDSDKTLLGVRIPFVKGIDGLLSTTASVQKVISNKIKWASGRKSLDDQLKELNEHSQSDVKWEQQGNTIVPKSLDVMQISIAQLSRSFVFSRIRRKLTTADYRKEFTLDLGATAETLIKTTSTVATSATTPSTTITTDHCTSAYRTVFCVSSTECCEWNTPDFKMIHSCGVHTIPTSFCRCNNPGEFCAEWRCCDGSICNSTCPPAAKFGYCDTSTTTPNCQSGLTCTADAVSLRIFPGSVLHHTTHGRCL